jgi:hypothetical protein
VLDNLPEYRVCYLRSDIQRDYLGGDDLVAAFEVLGALVDQVVEKYFVVVEGLLLDGHFVLLLGLHLVVDFLGFLIDL